MLSELTLVRKKPTLNIRTNQETYINELFLKWAKQSKKRFACGRKCVCAVRNGW